jgi:hypothetical protein
MNARRRAEFAADMDRLAGLVYRRAKRDPHLHLRDHRQHHPWVTGWLGDPFAHVWFVAENPSLTQVEVVELRAGVPTVEDQWSVSRGDQLFRGMLVRHGYKRGNWSSPGGWRCYVTDVIKSADYAGKWSGLSRSDRIRVAEAWAPVLRNELEVGRPKVIVSLGDAARRFLDHLEAAGLIPTLPARHTVWHYSYLGSRPDRAKRSLEERFEAWSEQFDQIRDALQSPTAR